MQATTRKILYTVVLAAAAAGVVVLFLPAPIDVDVAPVKNGPLVVTVDEDGETRAHDRYVVSAPVAGRVSRIELHEGDSVKETQVVAEIWHDMDEVFLVVIEGAVPTDEQITFIAMESVLLQGEMNKAVQMYSNH